MSSYWLRAVPRALVAWRFWPVPVFVGLLGLAPVSGCGEVTAAQSLPPSPPETDASFGTSFGGSVSDGATSCHPSDVTTFVATGNYQPAAAPSGACLGADGGGLWEAFYEACLGPQKTDAACNTYKDTPSNAACAACVLTPYTADQLGPILNFGEFVGENVAGCIQITTPPTELSCAEKVQALSDCENAACQANCPVTDPQSLTDRQNCSSEADLMGCMMYAGNASACQAAEANAGLAQPCTNTAFKAFYDAVVPLFCGQANVDAAAQRDAGSDDAALGSATDSGVHAMDAGTD